MKTEMFRGDDRRIAKLEEQLAEAEARASAAEEGAAELEKMWQEAEARAERYDRELAGRPMPRCANTDCHATTDGGDYWLCQSCAERLRAALERFVEEWQGINDVAESAEFQALCAALHPTTAPAEGEGA